VDLSKTLYIRGLQCEKSLWLKKHKPDVLSPPNEKLQQAFDDGHQFGALAQKLFPGGREIVFRGTTINQKLARTKQWIDQKVPSIYEATFKYNDVLCLVDILQINRDGSVEIYEVKNANEVKEVHINDAAIQYYIINGLGYHISKTAIVHRNAAYDGDDLESIFCTVDVSDKVLALQNSIPKHLSRFQDLLSEKTEPAIGMGDQCRHPYYCDAMAYCEKASGGVIGRVACAFRQKLKWGLDM